MSERTLLSHIYLTLGGADAPEALVDSLETVTVESSLHLPDVATLTIHDPRLTWIDDAALEPGAALAIWSTDGKTEEQLFDGEIVEVEPEFDQSTHRLVVRAFDRLHRLGHLRSVRTFVNVSDADLVRQLAEEAGLKARVAPADEVRPYVMQANISNLALLRERAAALGYLLYVEGETLCCEPPQSGAPPVELQWGSTLSTFRPRLTTVDQVSKVTVRGWDPDTRQEIVGEANTGQGMPQIGERRSGGELVQAAFQLKAETLLAETPVRTQAHADQLAQAAADRRTGRFVEAEGACSGNPSIVAGSAVRISAVGDRFSGDYLVTSATHRYSAGGYRTEFSVSGLNPATLLSRLRPEGSAPGFAAPVIAIVTDNQDPEGRGRVKVRFPHLSSEHTSDWARVVAPGGGAERGLQLIPEVNDEVLVAFELGDIHYPYIIGGLWNGQDAPPLPGDEVVASGKVRRRLLRSRTGHVLVLDDDDSEGGITLEDRSGNSIKIVSEKNQLRIAIKGDAEVKVGTEGKHPLVVESTGDIRLKAEGNLELDATGQVKVKGNNISIDGSPGNVDVKGTMINLN